MLVLDLANLLLSNILRESPEDGNQLGFFFPPLSSSKMESRIWMSYRRRPLGSISCRVAGKSAGERCLESWLLGTERVESSASLRSHFLEILKPVAQNDLPPAVPACCGLSEGRLRFLDTIWRTGWMLENDAFAFLQQGTRLHLVKSFFSRFAPFPWSCFSALDRDVLKKAIDEVTCWIATAEEEETMILHDLSGMQWGASLWHVWALE